MLLTDVSYNLECSDTKCGGSVAIALMNLRIPVERLYEKLRSGHARKCSMCGKPYVLPYMKAKVDMRHLREIKLRLQCKRCDSTWNTSISTNNSIKLSDITEDLKKNTMCFSPHCDNKTVQVLEARIT